MKNRTIFIIAAVTLVLILAFGFVMMKLIKKNNECVSNPFTYASKQIVDKEGKPIYILCSCQVNEAYFYFDNKGIYKENPLLNTTERGFEPWLNKK